ncbi:hypothetical protein ACSVHC_00670 [Arthrobacter sp. KNU-44]|uniref:hypothetical protein n=1 Tax=Arthrobacter sp. KNU-44 TaxID=3450744 RepID=UPI003F4421A1
MNTPSISPAAQPTDETSPKLKGTATGFLRGRTAAVAGTTFALSWLIGLLLPVPDLGSLGAHAAPRLSPSDTLVWMLQELLIHGAAGVALLFVFAALYRRLKPGNFRTRVALGTIGGAAVAVSLAQCAHYLVTMLTIDRWAASDLTGQVPVLDRMDGLKMALLGLTILVVTVAAVRFRSGRATIAIGALAALSLLATGIGFIALIPEVMQEAAVSLILLIAWVLVVSWRRRPIAGPLSH